MSHSRWHAGARAAAILMVVLMAACETAGGDPAAGDAEGTAQPDPAATATEQAALPSEPEIDDDPDRLIGLEPGAVFALLGQPELIRRESPAQVWQYRGNDCVFDIILYQEAERTRVTYVEARDGNGGRSEPRPCLNQLLRARLTDTSS
ncbi:MAG: hypothetical protein OEU09_06875 [Rhodospirillales bacterium]|nr:hypothetical protein [Rhodospirillales bacterium]MDH3792281.1 hypothetical protein [Rhodospirillales bacterium]MDH3911005.1 hypothetical protein [Rhodospirillales bacterium]MDH3919809.1 hypothetical protein [Rhodospirillales bacterium]MDH3966128.1 hypothetical protein [Rhodospirillales bacterium]